MTSRHPWAIVSIVIAALALWMGLGTLHDHGHADALLPVLISTQRWTPFYWGQDRFGMLVPLLAMPIRHPLANLLAQGWLMTAAALLAPFAVARFLTGRSGQWAAIGAGTNLLFLLITPAVVQFDWLVAQPYGLSISVGFAALIVAERRGRLWAIVAGVLLAVACWINIGVVVMLGIATVLQASRPLRLLALEAAAAAFAFALARYAATAHTATATIAPAQWINGWTRLFENSSAVIASPALAALVALATAVAIGRLWERGGWMLWRPATIALAVAIGTWLVTGTSLWVGMNGYVFRYMYPALMLAAVAVGIVLAAPFAGQAQALAVVTLTALTAVTCSRYGTPSIARVARGIDDRFGVLTPAVLRSGATVIAGDYWRVWPAVFHANLTLARSRAHARIFGLAYRSEDSDVLWKVAGRRVLIATPAGDAAVGAIADEHGIAVTPLEHLPTIDLYSGVP